MVGSFLRELKLLENFMEFGGLSQTIYRFLWVWIRRASLFSGLNESLLSFGES